MSFTNAEVLPKFGGWYRPLLGLDPYNKKAVDDASKAALNATAVFESHLTAHTYLVGERITLADFFAAALLTRAFATVLDKEWRHKNPAVTRWYETIISQPIFKSVFPNPVFAEEAVKFTPPKKEEKPKKEKAAPAPKAAAAAAEEGEEQPKPAPKPKHPLEALGKPEFNLEDWKRLYSNEDTRTGSLPWFWEHYKPDEFSLWLVDYKYNDELKLTFMANNLIGKFVSFIYIYIYVYVYKFLFLILLFLHLQAVSKLVSRDLESTSLVRTRSTAQTTTASRGASTLPAVRNTCQLLKWLRTGRATTSASSTTPAKQTASLSQTCGRGMCLSLLTGRSILGLMDMS